MSPRETVGDIFFKVNRMVWNKNNYPDSFRNLDDKVREKAIEIANALVEKENMDESRAIPVAISKARETIAKS